VEARGKHLLIRFDNGLVLRTHLGMHGSWHRYAPGERWQRPQARARIVLETESAVAVCFDAPTVELFDARAEAIHPRLSALGPDLLSPEFEDEATAEVLHRLRAPERAGLTIAEALLDQRALAGIGNIYKNETLFTERVHPFTPVGDLDDETILRLVATARRLLLANSTARRGTIPPGPAGIPPIDGHWVYDRSGRPCRRCGTLIQRRSHGELDRSTYWCPACQHAPEEGR
jgi:endonuclease-8